MSSTVSDTPTAGVRDRLRAVVDELQTVNWDALPDADVVELLTEVETAKRRHAPVDHAVLNQLAQRSVAATHGARSTAAFVSNRLRISRAEATARIKAAEALGYRRNVTGCLVEPQYPLVAAAQADGIISERHAAVIVQAVQKLPDPVADEFGEFVEKALLETAHDTDPKQLAQHARALTYLLDQDGQLDDDRRHERKRGLELHRRPDGSARLEGELTAEAAELLQTVLDALTKPKPTAADGGAGDGGSVAEPDRRAPSQRRHDAFVEALKAALRAREIPNAGGVTTTVVLTLDADAWITGAGTARTGHGYIVPAAVAKRWTGSGADARFVLALLSKTKAVEAYSSSQRIFTEQQRLALIARDGGCSHPGCDAAPAFTETHHIIPWQDGGPTSIDNGTLVCSYHHRHALEEGGWQVVTLDGIPHWIPPAHLDPDQTPRRNTRHDRPRPDLPS